MAGTKKPKTVPATPWPAVPDAIHQEGTWNWLPLKGEWRDSTGKPEELVRQKFIRHLCENYGYALEQMRQEMRMISGIFVDETRAPVLDPGRKATKSGYFWAVDAIAAKRLKAFMFKTFLTYGASP